MPNAERKSRGPVAAAFWVPFIPRHDVYRFVAVKVWPHEKLGRWKAGALEGPL